jgi:hypothetical protein
MKKNLLVAAGLLTFGLASTLTSTTKAEDMFQVVAASPGTINFSGSGTAQFNNSLGTNNSFQVGSSTNLGVNANVSSTTGYAVDSTADLGLAANTTLNQVIGTSGAANTSSAQKVRAHETARSAMSSWEATYGSSWEYGNSSGYGSAAEWQAGYDAEYERQYNTAVSSTTSTESSSSSATDGTISGSFRTIEAGTARASGSASDWDTSASTSASAEWGVDYESYRSNGGVDVSSEAEWQVEYDRSYNSAYANASAASNRYSDSTVNVTGIGSDATVIASDASNFLVDIGQNDGANPTSSTSTANGSAGASLATSSFANQSSSSTASGFLQAFGGSVASSSTEAPTVSEMPVTSSFNDPTSPSAPTDGQG